MFLFNILGKDQPEICIALHRLHIINRLSIIQIIKALKDQNRLDMSKRADVYRVGE